MVGTNNETIRQDALKNQWELDDLLKKGRVTECGMLAASEIKPDPIHGNINRTKSAVYSKKQKSREKSKVPNNNSKFICWKCEDNACPGYNKCKYHNKECKKCKQYGHSPKSRLCKANKKSYEKHESNRKKTNRTEIISSESSSNESTSNSSSSDNENIQTIYTSKKKHYPKILTLKVDLKHVNQLP